MGRSAGPWDSLGGGAASSILLAVNKMPQVTVGSPEFHVPLTVGNKLNNWEEERNEVFQYFARKPFLFGGLLTIYLYLHI